MEVTNSKQLLEDLKDELCTYTISQEVDDETFQFYMDSYEQIKKDLDRLKELEDEYAKMYSTMKIIKDCIIVPIEDDIAKVDFKGNNYYALHVTRRLINEQEYDLLKEALSLL